jgi:hypothetical protein
MQIGTVGTVPVTIGWIIAVLVLLIAILGLLNVVPFTATVVFGLIAATAIARLI